MLIYGVFFATMAVIADGLSRIWEWTKEKARSLAEKAVGKALLVWHGLTQRRLFQFFFTMFL